MHQQQQLARGGARGAQRGQVEWAAVLAQFHGDGQRVGILGQAVAHDAVQGRQHRLALGRGRGGIPPGHSAIQKGFEPQQRGLQPGIDQPCHAMNALVNHAGQPARAAGLGPTGQAHGAEHRLVHALGDACHTRRGLGGQARRAPQIGGAQLAHGRLGDACRLAR